MNISWEKWVCSSKEEKEKLSEDRLQKTMNTMINNSKYKGSAVICFYLFYFCISELFNWIK